MIIPFALFVLESCLATFCYFTYSNSDPFLKLLLGQLLAVNVTLAGLLHFFPPLFDFYASMIFLPFKKFWLYLTGFALIFSGIGICFQITQVVAAKCLTLTLIAMFPGNVFCVFNPRAKQLVFGGSTTKALIRLPFQVPFVIWAWWYVTPPF